MEYQYQQGTNPPQPYPTYQPGGGQQQQSVVIINQQPTAMTTSGQPQNIREWSTGLCGCCEDCGDCVLAFLCPCIHLCCLASSMNENTCGPHMCGMSFVVAMRTKLRTMYGIRGSICDDHCCVNCCPCCAITQMHRELKNSGFIR